MPANRDGPLEDESDAAGDRDRASPSGTMPEARRRGRPAAQSISFDRVHRTAPPIGRVLILDEDTAASAAAAEMLAKDGHDVERRADLEEGITYAIAVGIDVVVADPFGGRSSSQRLVERLRTPDDGVNQGPEVVIVSSLNDVDAAVAALHQGASDYLVKPVPDGRLRLAIAHALERRRLLNENTRLKRDLALFAAGQRILETLDAGELARRGLDALCSFSEAMAGVIMSPEGPLVSRGLTSDEVRAVNGVRAPLNFTDHVEPGQLHPTLDRFTDGLMLDFGEDRFAILFASTPGVERHLEENALFLSRHLATAFKNVVRFAHAEREARRDPLTGLWNARAFEEALHQLAMRASLEKMAFSLLFVDVDRFKSVNDQHGHLVGSQLLVEMSQVLCRCVREGDIVGRYGGDEFVLLLPDVDKNAALLIAERIRRIVDAHKFLADAGLALHLTICLGVATHPDHGATARALLDMADRAMYLGKGATRNSVHVAGAPKT